MDINNKRSLANELRTYLDSESSRFKNGPIAHRFIRWFVEAQFGENINFTLTDQKGDGGIDGIIYDQAQITVLQSKYEESAKLATSKRSDLDAFERVKSRLLDDDDEAFDN